MEEEHLRREDGASPKGVAFRKRIPFLGGRPDRDQPISEDDITNLRIALNTTRSVAALLRKV
jgi:hypothetical protein